MNHSLPSDQAGPARNGNSIRPARDGETRQVCAHCGAEIVDGHWFCRLPGNDAPTLLCRPACVLRKFDHSHAGRNGADRDWDSREHQFNFIMKGEDDDGAESFT